MAEPFKNRIDLRDYIRWQLSQLGARNQPSAFEGISYELARMKICDNLVYPTGPVQAGGDQGKDFETYRTFMSQSPLHKSSFVGVQDDNYAAFACSLEKEVNSKIRRDLKTIFGCPIKPKLVYFFCEPSLAVAKRHKAQDECKQNYGVNLEIFDGDAIADMLASTDTFWIAEKFLSISANMFPVLSGDEGYDALNEKWLIEKAAPENYADYLEIKEGLRAATFNEYAKPDLLSWLELIKKLGEQSSPKLHRKIQYEICVATLRGFNNLDPEKAIVEDYFNKASSSLSIEEVRDTATLLMYCHGGQRVGHFTVENEVLKSWANKLLLIIDTAISTASNKGDKCSLYETRGLWEMLPTNERPFEESLDKVCDWWEKVAQLVKQYPLYPIRPICDLGDMMVSLGDITPRFKKLLATLDELLSSRSSNYTLASKARDRAASYMKRKKWIEAIEELHKTKINWFAGDTLEGAILAMRGLSGCYAELKLSYAAMYYSEAALFVAINHDSDSLKSSGAKAAIQSARMMFESGAGLSSIVMAERALLVHLLFASEGGDFTQYPEVQRVVFNVAMYLTIAKRLNPAVHSEAVGLVKSWSGMPLDIPREILNLGEIDNHKDRSDDDIIHEMDKSYGVSLFSDIGAFRVIRWKALGVDWNIRFENNPSTTSIAEALVATLQIFQVEFADIDLIVIPTSVYMTVERGEVADRDILEALPDNEKLAWKLIFNEKQASDDRLVFGITATIFSHIIGLNPKKFEAIIDAKLADGLPTRAIFVRTPYELFKKLKVENEPLFEKLSSLRDTSIGIFTPVEHASLKWNDSLSPEYSLAKANEFLTNRYSKLIKMMGPVLSEVLSAPLLREAVNEMRLEGSKDWQILVFLQNLIQNTYLRLNPDKFRSQSGIEELMRQTFAGELDLTALKFDYNLIDADEIRFGRKIGALAVLKTWGIESTSSTPMVDSYIKLLDVRYRNSTDDIEHENIFNWAA